MEWRGLGFFIILVEGVRLGSAAICYILTNTSSFEQFICGYDCHKLCRHLVLSWAGLLPGSLNDMRSMYITCNLDTKEKGGSEKEERERNEGFF